MRFAMINPEDHPRLARAVGPGRGHSRWAPCTWTRPSCPSPGDAAGGEPDSGPACWTGRCIGRRGWVGRTSSGGWCAGPAREHGAVVGDATLDGVVADSTIGPRPLVTPTVSGRTMAFAVQPTPCAKSLARGVVTFMSEEPRSSICMPDHAPDRRAPRQGRLNQPLLSCASPSAARMQNFFEQFAWAAERHTGRTAIEVQHKDHLDIDHLRAAARDGGAHGRLARGHRHRTRRTLRHPGRQRRALVRGLPGRPAARRRRRPARHRLQVVAGRDAAARLGRARVLHQRRNISRPSAPGAPPPAATAASSCCTARPRRPSASKA